jgi:hypothetical protein
MSEELTVIERNNLVELEETIQKNLTAFYEVGFALMQIRDNRLYREIYGTFEEYCKEKWGFTKSRANQLISASEVADNLTTTVAKEIPERHLRPLTSLPPEEQREVYQKAVETAPDGKVTAKHVEETIKEVKKSKGPEKQEGECRYTETYPVTDALIFAGFAISQLERIRDDDPKREDAFVKIETWIKNKRR